MTGPAHPALSEQGTYRKTRFSVAAITLGRMMALFGNETTHPEIVTANRNCDRADDILTRYIAALERVAESQLQLAAIQRACGLGGLLDGVGTGER